MLVQKKRIQNAKSYLSKVVPPGGTFRLVASAERIKPERFQSIGFTAPLKAGDTVLPDDVGAVSRFNAYGRWDIHKDQPKEDRYVRTVYWTWREWRGRHDYEDKSDFRDIYQKCYPRTFVHPPCLELTIVERDDGQAVALPELTCLPKNEVDLRHAINLMLELFGECEIVDANLAKIPSVIQKRVAWEILPPGHYPFAAIKKHLGPRLAKKGDGDARVILDRQQTILSLNPDEQYTGVGGFSDYIAYVFKGPEIVVLESVQLGNAIYVFGKDWKRFSQMSKAEILKNNHQMARIVHSSGWKGTLARLIDAKKAA